MVYSTPTLTREDQFVLAGIDDLRSELASYLRLPRRWYGTIRRATVALAIQGSNSIEGYHASVEDVAALMEGEEPLQADEETRHAIEGYRDAMTYVIQLAGSPPMPTLDASLVKSLHFMMLKHDLSKRPGQWRPGAVWVSDEQGRTVYEAPDRIEVETLMSEAFDAAASSDVPTIVRAAMVHLNLALVHPFSDGNGRMARCLQSYVLAEQRILSPEFLSVEEYLGRNTRAYYDVLTGVARGKWSPQRDASAWLRFSLTAHHRQARTLLQRVKETEALWDRVDQLVRRRGLPDRCIGALCDAARGWRLRRALYVKTVASSAGVVITDATATRDLSAMAAAGLLQPSGEKRGRTYQPTAELRDVWQSIRGERREAAPDDPYELVRRQRA